MPTEDGVQLELASSEAWVECALAAPNQLLDDHAQCELKAAANALALVGRHPERSALVRALSGLAIEETRHFRLVRRLLRRRGGSLGRPQRSPYLAGLSLERRGGQFALLEELLIAAVVEARSCERFERLEAGFRRQGEVDLADLYARLIRSERGHAALFADLAQRYFERPAVEAEWAHRLELEMRTLDALAVSPRMHGGHRLA